MKHAILAAPLVFAFWATTATATPFPGPDGFGYSGASIAFNWRDISATGTQAFGGSATDDNVTGAVGIGFGFSFYGTTYTDAYIGSNGFVTFSANQSQGCCSGGPLPGTTNPSNLVAGWFTDLISGNFGFGFTGGDIRYQTLGTAGSREFIVEYLNNPYCCITDVNNTFEIILHEGSNDIELQYDHTSADSHTRSVGIENAGGTIGLQRLFDNTSLLNSAGICISTGNTSCNAPEPATLTLMSLALAGFGAFRKKQRS